MKDHIKRVWELREAKLTATHVVEAFARCRIIPLKNWDPAYTYKGVLDPYRESVEGMDLSRVRVRSYSGVCFFLLFDQILTRHILIEVPDEEVARWVEDILDVGLPDWENIPRPYHAGNPPPQVKAQSPFVLLLRSVWANLWFLIR